MISGRKNDSSCSFNYRVYESAEQIPRPINGLALGNVGLAVLWLNLGLATSFRASVLWFVYLFTVVSVILLLLYIVKIVVNPWKWVLNDLSSPDRTMVLGVIAMTVSLIAVIASSHCFTSCCQIANCDSHFEHVVIPFWHLISLHST